MPAQLTHEQFFHRFNALNKPLKILGTYTRHCDKIEIECLICNSILFITGNKLLNKDRFNCRVCGYKRLAEKQRKDPEIFNKQIKDLHPQIQLLSSYISDVNKVKCLCKICDYEWMAIPSNLLQGNGCFKCSYKIRGKNQEKGHIHFLKELAKINKSIIVESEYQSNKTKLICKCINCDHKWSATPNNLLRGKSCPKCMNIQKGISNRRDHEDYIKAVKAFNPMIEITGTYITHKTPLKGKCLHCQHERVSDARSFLHAKCPNCNLIGFRMNEPGFFYLTKIHINGSVFYGFGITNNIARRMQIHKTNLAISGGHLEKPTIWEFPLGKQAFALEKSIKKQLKCRGNVPVDGFKTEAILPKDISNLYALIERHQAELTLA